MSIPNISLPEILGIEYPIIGGAMYPCSNPELIAAVSEAGGIGIVQPISLTYVNGYDFRQGLQHIRQLTSKPIGLNLLIEKSSKTYFEKNIRWLEIALEEGVRFFISALGKPDWIVKRLSQVKDSYLFHDVTNRTWAQKAVDSGVDGLICVNNRAGGHAGTESPQELYNDLKDFKLPLVCAGGVGGREQFESALKMGYCAVQMGSRFIATTECTAHLDYKQAIVEAQVADIILTKKLTGVPVAVINTDYMQKKGAQTGAIANWLLKNNKTKHLMRMLYMFGSIWRLKKSLKQGANYLEFYQAGKSVGAIHNIQSVQDVFDEMLVSWQDIIV